VKNLKFTLGIVSGFVLMTAVVVYLRKNSLSNFKKKVVKNAIHEWVLWGRQLSQGGSSLQTGSKECSFVYQERVGEYWKKGTDKNYDGCSDVPWSAAFISFIMKKSGAGNTFPYTAAHTNYIREFINNREQGKAFEAYRLTEKPLEIGDLICYSRQDDVNYDSTHSYLSHCDIVVKLNRSTAEAIGGNVSDGVTKRIVEVDKDGYLTDTYNDWFTIIKTMR
jgi:hypothetical protein